MITDSQFSQRIQCSLAEKRQCMPLVVEIIKLAAKARRDGLLGLVKDAEETSSFLLCKGLQLLVDGIEPEVLREILEAYILSGNYYGLDYLQRRIVLEGILAIQSGMHPKVIRELLLAYFGEDGYQIYAQEFEDTDLSRLAGYLRRIKNAKSSSPAAAEVSNAICEMNADEIQKILKRMSTVDLARAMTGLGGKSQIRIFACLPRKSALALHEEIEYLGPPKKAEALAAQKNVLTLISDLQDQGEIQGLKLCDATKPPSAALPG